MLIFRVKDKIIQCKLLAICLLSNSLEVHIFLFQKTRVYKGIPLQTDGEKSLTIINRNI